jgi:NlpC/P60 family putative phage cell wall peptidase
MIGSREQVIVEARRWIGTPYDKGFKAVLQVGCNCATLIYAVYRACGLIPDEQIGVFSPDWYANTKEEKYMLRILRHAASVGEAIAYPTMVASPGNVVLTRSWKSKVYNHAGIVTKWPMLIHALAPKVEEVDATTHRLWQFRTVQIFDPWLKAEQTEC